MRLRYSKELPASPTELVAVEPTDAETFAPWLNDHDVTEPLSIWRLMTVAAERAHLEKTYERPDHLLLGIWLKAEARLIGACGLHHIDQRDSLAVFGIFIGDKTQWSKKYGTHAVMQTLHIAFARIHLRLVTLQVLGFNTRAMRCYSRAGFKEVGRIPEARLRNFAYHDDVTMAVRSDHWLPLWRQYLADLETT